MINLKDNLRKQALSGPPSSMHVMNFLHAELTHTHLDDSLESAYHYTDLNGFFNILQNRELWISNVNYLNDRQELQDGITACIGVIQDFLAQELDSRRKEFLYHLLSRIEKGESDGSWAVSQADVFAMSFCAGSDLLTQLREYGVRGGIAIGFNIYQLQNECRLAIVPNHRPQENGPPRSEELDIPVLQKVVYDDLAKTEIIRHILSFGFEMLDHNDTPAAFHKICAEFSDVLLRYVPLFKNQSFFSEQEMRYVYTRSAAGGRDRTVHFRPRNGLILPFLKFRLLDREGHPLDTLPIQHIIVGPCPQQKDLEDSIKYYLRNNGNPDLVYCVRRSAIPYRG